jgi:hypothetical protein
VFVRVCALSAAEEEGEHSAVFAGKWNHLDVAVKVIKDATNENEPPDRIIQESVLIRDSCFDRVVK